MEEIDIFIVTFEKNIAFFPGGYGPVTIILKTEISFIKDFS